MNTHDLMLWLPTGLRRAGIRATARRSKLPSSTVSDITRHPERCTLAQVAKLERVPLLVELWDAHCRPKGGRQ